MTTTDPRDAGSAAPLIELTGVLKHLGAEALRIASFRLDRGDRYVLSGLDPVSAEAVMHLITGAALPDAGDVRLSGRSTREVTTDLDWLASLDGFGLVSERSVLLDGLPVAASVALPLTIAIDPMTPEIRTRVETLARQAGLFRDRLDLPAGTLVPLDRMRVHLARALALDPRALLLEHPTAKIDDAAAEAFGADLRRAADERHIGWLAISDDEAFIRAAGGRRVRIEAGGQLAELKGRGWRHRMWPWK